LRCVTER